MHEKKTKKHELSQRLAQGVVPWMPSRVWHLQMINLTITITNFLWGQFSAITKTNFKKKLYHNKTDAIALCFVLFRVHG